jgi:hypothetical protein
MLCASVSTLGATSDPFFLPDVNVAGFPIFKDRTDRIQVNPALVAGETTDIALWWGQSLAAFHEETAYLPTSITKVQQIDPYSGGVFQYANPGLGSTSVAVDGSPGSSYIGRLAQKRIMAGNCARFMGMSIAVAGSNVAQWAPGGVHNQRLRVALRRLASIGLLGNLKYVVSQIGEADNTLGTTHAAFASSLAGVHQTLRDEGATCKFLNALSTTQNDGSTSSAVRAAVTAAIDHSSGIYAGADTDTLTGPTNRDPGSHLTATGSDSNASLWMAALTAAGI